MCLFCSDITNEQFQINLMNTFNILRKYEGNTFNKFSPEPREIIKDNPTEGFTALTTVELISKKGLTKSNS